MRSEKWIEVNRNAFNDAINGHRLEGHMIRSSGPEITAFYQKNRKDADGPVAKIEWPHFDWPQRYVILEWLLNEK